MEYGVFSVSCLFKTVEGDIEWAITGVYGPVVNCHREDLWEELSVVAFCWGVPWCVGGDFNVVRFPHERMGCNSISRNMRRFSDFINDLELVDPPLNGSRFTWSENQDVRCMSRIDRFLISSSWEELCPGADSACASKTYLRSCPNFIRQWRDSSWKDLFWFENMWLLSEGFLE